MEDWVSCNIDEAARRFAEYGVELSVIRERKFSVCLELRWWSSICEIEIAKERTDPDYFVEAIPILLKHDLAKRGWIDVPDYPKPGYGPWTSMEEIPVWMTVGGLFMHGVGRGVRK